MPNRRTIAGLHRRISFNRRQLAAEYHITRQQLANTIICKKYLLILLFALANIYFSWLSLNSDLGLESSINKQLITITQVNKMNADQIRAKNAEKKRKYRELETPKQKDARRIADKERKQKIRLSIIPEKRTRAYRKETLEQRKLRLELDRKRATTRRKSETPEQRKLRLELDRKRAATRRLLETDEQKKARRKAERERQRYYRNIGRRYYSQKYNFYLHY